jgi:cytoskeletal protein RodZ
MYLILALLFCVLLVVALGIVLFVSLTSDRGGQPAEAPQTQQEAPQSAAASPGLRVPSSVPGVRAPSVTSPSLRAPSVTAPSVSGSGISSGSVSAPSVSGPHVSAPSVSRPSMPSMPRASTSLPRASSGQLPATSAAPQAGAQPAAESGGTPYLALIIILSILLVIAVGAGVYFALRRS